MWSMRTGQFKKLCPGFSVARATAFSHSFFRGPIAQRPLSTHLSTAALATRSNPSFDQHALAVNSVSSDDLPIVSVDNRKIAVGWDTRNWSRFHNIWLRDHCRCSACFHSITKQRLVNTFEISADIMPISAQSTATGLEVTWPGIEAHVSLYPWSWLRQNSYDPPMRVADSVPEKIMWGSRIDQSPPTVTYEEAMSADDRGLYKWLTNINKFGFSFVTGVPATTEATEKLSERIGFIRETQYGKFWDFTADLAKGDTAYTNLALGAHTDNTYFTDPCGLQLFHLLSHNGSGGETLLVDGFYVATILKELHPEVYSLLSTITVPAHAAGDLSSIYRPYPSSGYPVLGHDSISGELAQVRWNNDDRSVMNHLSPHLVEDWYNAIRIWNKLLNSPDSQYWVQLKPGTAVVVDNYRVLHGRSAFDGKRRMCGAYIGADEYYSKLAVLTEKFTTDSAISSSGAGFERSVWNPLL